MGSQYTYDALYGAVKKTASAGYTALSALIWPPRSPVTGASVSAPGMIEAEHWKTLSFCMPPLCTICGFSFPADLAPATICAACQAAPPTFDSARAALVYGDTCKKMIMSLKYGGRRDALRTMAGWMRAAASETLDQCDALVPVPLHYRRFVRRGFNQSAWLAAALSRASGVPVCLRALVRSRATQSQAGKSASARLRSVQGAFAVAQPDQVAGRHLALIDDVLTTGATLNACARALKRAGAARVDAITLARVDHPTSVDRRR